jgi:addiction module HigA family antidote
MPFPFSLTTKALYLSSRGRFVTSSFQPITRDLLSIHVPYQRVNEIINKKRGITPSTALRLAKFFGMSEDFWLNLQLRCDLYQAKQVEAEELKQIHVFIAKIA